MAKVPKSFTPKSTPKKKEERAETSTTPGLDILNQWFQFSMESARKKHWEWFVIDQFIRGNHDIKGNSEDNSLVIRKSRSSINYPINKVYATFRAVRGYVTRHKPKVEIDIQETTDDAKQYARRANRTLERDNQLNNFRKINKEWVYYGVKYGKGYRQVGYDPNRKVSMRWSIDPFDLLVGTKNGKMEDAPYIIKTVVRTKDYIKNKFSQGKDVSADNQIAASEYKKLMLEMQFDTTNTSGQDEGNQTVILKECWYRVFDPNKYGGFVNKITFTENMILLHEETPFDEYPFISYDAEVLPNENFPDGHIKHIISPQRMFNMLNTQELEYNHITNRGRFVTEKGSGFRVINTAEGQIITVNKGKTVRVLTPPALNPSITAQKMLALKMIEDIGGQSDAIRGVAPYSGASGDAIEQLQIAGTNDINDLRDNFEDSLANEAAWILKMYSLFEQDGVVLTDNTMDEPDKFGVVGSEAYKRLGKEVPDKYFLEEGGNYCGICAIFPDNQCKASVTTELGETKQARQDLMFKLLDAGLPLQSVLKHLEFPNTQDVLQRIAEEQAADIVTEQLKGPQTPAQVPQDDMLAAELEQMV